MAKIEEHAVTFEDCDGDGNTLVVTDGMLSWSVNGTVRCVANTLELEGDAIEIAGLGRPRIKNPPAGPHRVKFLKALVKISKSVNVTLYGFSAYEEQTPLGPLQRCLTACKCVAK